MSQVVISGTGLWKPQDTITNQELVASYNAYANKYNETHVTDIASGTMTAKPLSSAEFIEKASGIKSRYIYKKEGTLDIERMMPIIPPRADTELSDQAEMALHAAHKAMALADKAAKDIDVIIVACAYTQRSYPAIAIEVQEALGVKGFGFDMLVACSAATFGLHRAYEMIKAGTANCVMVINPELTSPQVNYKDRDSHFIFGDVSIATILEKAETCTAQHSYEILSTKAMTAFSNNIRSNFGYVLNANDANPLAAEQFFSQKGRSVFKEVCPMAAEHISTHLQQHQLSPPDIKRWWLHQANINMNNLIFKMLMNRPAEGVEAPIVLDEFANTASAGSLIAFNLYHEDLEGGDHGIICSFGAGYSIGSLVVKKRD